MDCGESAGEEETLTHAEFQLPHHLPKHTYIVITTEQRRARTGSTHVVPATLSVHVAPVFKAALLLITTAASNSETLSYSIHHVSLELSACSYLFKLSEAVHLYRWAFIRLITREICTE